MPEKTQGFLASLGKHRFIMAALLAVGAALIAVGVLGRSAHNADERTEYERTLEERVERLCLSVAGIDEANALVTVDGVPGEIASRYYAASDAPTVRGVALVVTRGDDPEVARRVTELVASSLGIATSRVSVAPCK